MTMDAFIDQLQYLPQYLGHHLLLTILALTAGIVVCIPLGSLITRIKPLAWPVLTVAGILQTVPGIALLALMVPILGMIGFVPAILALIVYSILPILRNTVTGILEVDPAITEAARGIGMTDRQILTRVELPLALPVIIAGIRTAAVWVVGTATLATPVGAISLGNYIFSGLQTQNLAAVVLGALAAAVLAIIIDQLVRLAEVATVRRSRTLGIVAAVLLILLIGGGLTPMALERSERDTRGTVIIGAKTFTEQYILADLIGDKVAAAGFQPDVRSGMGSILLFQALSEGGVDCYVDYSGTVWANSMNREYIPGRQEVLTEMTAWLKTEHRIVNLGSLGFENTYALAVRRETAEDYHLKTIDDLKAVAGQMSIGSDYEFFSRPEWATLQNKYGLQFREQLTLDPTLMYSAVAEGECDVITAFSTDGRIVAYDLVLLQDTRQAFPPYDAVLLLSESAAENDRLVDALRPLVGSIPDSVMRYANKIVDLDGATVDSAATYLRYASGAADAITP